MRSFTFIMLLTLSVLAGCKDSAAPAKESKPQEAIPVTLGPTRVGSIGRTVEVIGTLYGDEETVLSAKVPGRVTEIFKDVGDRVNEGEALAQIEKTDYELAVAQAQMTLQQTLAKLGLTELPDEKFNPAKVPTVEQKRLQAANAEARFKRAEQLFQKQPPLISEQDYADQKTSFEVARSESEVAMLEAKALLAEVRSRRSDLNVAEKRLDDASIRAPRLTSASTTQAVGGRFGVAGRMVSIGEYVREGTAMFRLVADSSIKYRANVPERFSGQIQVGQHVLVTVESVNKPFVGKVTRINPQVDQLTRSFQVEVLVPNPTGQLRPGAFARGSIRTSVAEGVTFAPNRSVISFAGVNKIFTVKDGKAVESRVELGTKLGEEVEIVSGLKGNPQVVVQGAAQLAGGVPVAVQSGPTTSATQPK